MKQTVMNPAMTYAIKDDLRRELDEIEDADDDDDGPQGVGGQAPTVAGAEDSPDDGADPDDDGEQEQDADLPEGLTGDVLAVEFQSYLRNRRKDDPPRGEGSGPEA